MRKFLLLSLLSVILTAIGFSASARTVTDEFTFNKKKVTATTAITTANYSEYMPEGWSILGNNDYSWDLLPAETEDGNQILKCKISTSWKLDRHMCIYAHKGTLTFNIKSTSQWSNPALNVWSVIENNGTKTIDKNSQIADETISDAADKYKSVNVTILKDGYYAFNTPTGQIISVTNTYESQAATYSVSGKICGEQSEPLEGALVSIGTHSATTDAEGKYTITEVESGTHTLSVSLDEYSTETKDIIVADADLEVGDIYLSFILTLIQGYLQSDYNGEWHRVLGGHIALYHGNTWIATNPVSYDDGSYQIILKGNVESEYTMKITSPFFQETEYEVTGVTRGAIVERNPAITAIKLEFKANVKDNKDNIISGASVVLTREGGETLTAAETSTQGEYIIQKLLAHEVCDYEYNYTVTAEGYPEATGTVIFRGKNQSIDVTLVKPEPTVISGKVTDENGVALSGAHVTLTMADQEAAFGTVDTDSEGLYSFSSFDITAPCSILVEATYYAPYTQQVDALENGALNNIDIQLTPITFTYTGIVKNEAGELLTNAAIKLDGEDLTANEEGLFVKVVKAMDVYDREVPVVISCYGYDTKEVTLPIFDDVVATYFLAESTNTAIIKVVDEQQNAIEDAVVTVTPEEGETITPANWGEGTYGLTLRLLADNGKNYTVSVSAPNYESNETTFTYNGEDVEVTVELAAIHNGINSILNDANGELTIFNIQGVRINANDIERLPAGLYIINGKKAIIR